MAMKTVILAGYKNGTPRNLKRAIPGAQIINPYKLGDEALRKKTLGHQVINWGTRPSSGQLSIIGLKSSLNCNASVETAINKRKTFEALSRAGVKCLEWTDKFSVAHTWLTKGTSVFGRKLVEGSGGDGIVLALKDQFLGKGFLPENFQNCSIWTRNFPKEAEVRVHVFRDKVIDYAEKRRVNAKRFAEDKEVNAMGKAKPDFWVRNHQNGWIYCRLTDSGLPVTRNKNAEQLAVDACRAIGLDFGAVDILIGGKGDAIVCEINTAPGLEGKSLESYVNAFLTCAEKQKS